MSIDPTKVVANKPRAKAKFNNPSNMGKLSNLYQMRIRLCDKEGVEEGTDQVVAVAISGELALESQYSTPFDQYNLGNRMPTVMGMAQTGDWVNTLDSGLSNVFGIELSGDKKEALNRLEGRSNLTKINSTQVFVSAASVTIPATIYFGAWESAKVEVEDQIRLLQQWALPKELAKGSIVAEFNQNASLESLFPSEAPPYVAVYYGGKRYLPLLIQTVSAPLVVPMDAEGNRMQLEVQVTFMSRTAWDAANINQVYGG